MTPATLAHINALRAQRNREADAVAELNGLVADLRHELERTQAALEDARAALAKASAPDSEEQPPAEAAARD